MKMILKICIAVGALICGNAMAQNSATFEIVAPGAMPLKPPSGEVEKFAATNAVTEQASGAVYYKDRRKHGDFLRERNTVQDSADGKTVESQHDLSSPIAVKDLTKVKLAFNPKKHSVQHKLLAASPAGTLTNKGWTGLDRYVAIENVGTYKLTEIDLTKTRGKFFLSSDAINANVENSPAATKTFIDDNGNIVEEVVWVSEGKFHMLTYAPETQPSSTGNLRNKKLITTSALTLVQELRN